MNPFLKEKILDIQGLCREYQVKSFFLFGSGATGTFTEQSDIDFLVKFRDEVPVLDYSDLFFGLHERLEKLLKRKVDLVPSDSLRNPYLIASIEKTKLSLYEA
jgi:predicted nucleotidyltransferase